MKIKVLLLSMVIGLFSTGALGDRGGVPNPSSCGPGNASFCEQPQGIDCNVTPNHPKCITQQDVYFGGPTSVSTGPTSLTGGPQDVNVTTEQDMLIDASDSSTYVSEVTYDNDYPAASAAAVFAQQCQTGMSGQVGAGGFSVVNSDQFCDYIRLAQAMQSAYTWETTSESGDPVKAQEYLDAYHEALDDSVGLIESTEAVGWLDRVAGSLVRPVGLVAVLILLL